MPRGIVTEDPQCIALGWPSRYPGLVNVPFITGPQSFRERILFINISYSNRSNKENSYWKYSYDRKLFTLSIKR